MFDLAIRMAWLPVQLVWRAARWIRRWLAARRERRRWQPMAEPLGRATPPVPRIPALAATVSERSAVARGGEGGSMAAGGAGTEQGQGGGEAVAIEMPELARFHSREGDGFKLIFHFLLKKQRVRRTVWLDFTRLSRRMGREQAWAMRARLGHAQMRYAVDRPSQPWGRVELPEVWLALDSTRSQKARSFMLDSLDAVNLLIDQGGIDLVSGRHQCIPGGDQGPAAVPAAAARRSKSGSRPGTQAAALSPQAELPLTAPEADSAGSLPPMPATLPGPEEDQAGLPRGVIPEHVCTGILTAAGVTERTDASGRNYRIFYADVDVEGRLSRQTGADLERALYDAHASVGARVRLQHLGYVPVNGGRHRRKVWHATVLTG